jgi:hypothetical protein
MRSSRRLCCWAALVIVHPFAATGQSVAGEATPDPAPVALPSGFVALFNGADLNGWKGVVGDPDARKAMSPEALAAAQERADQSMREHWTAVNGELVFDGRGENLCTVRDYESFELYIDWKIEPGGDSGIYLRGVPQVQIWDPADGEQNRVGSGGLFNNQQHPDEPLVCADRPVGEWNTFYIMMMGDRVSVKLNRKLVVDNVVLENYWDRSRPVARRGPIELQSHGSRVSFRNIFLRELPPDPSPPWQVLFDGSDLDQWEFPSRGWRIDEGALAASRRRRNREGDNTIWTRERFGDFVLDLEFQLSPDSESGIFLRTDDRANRAQTGIEIQLCDSHARLEVGQRDCGAICDMFAPAVNAARPPEEWNHITIVAQDNLLSVVLNDQRVVDLDLNLWTDARRNPDGSPNPYETACRDLKREGFIGFEDQGSAVAFRNVRIKRLDEADTAH